VDQNGKPDSLIPTEVITCKELVLDSHGHILEQNRLPGENEVRNQNSLFFYNVCLVSYNVRTVQPWNVCPYLT